MAPEVYDGKTQLKSDVWSLGISLMELADAKNPYADCTSAMVMKRVFMEDPPSLSSSKWSSAFVSFVNRCLQFDVEKRASVNELLEVCFPSYPHE